MNLGAVRAAALLAAAALAACGAPPQADAPPRAPYLHVERFTWTPSGANGESDGYLVVRNEGATPDTLTAASSPLAQRIDVRDTRLDANGAPQTFPIADAVSIPALGEVRFAPGGLYLAAQGLRAPLAEGDRAPVTLTFARSGAIEVEAVVASAAP